jgi:iron complex transport system ATP-binding protein
MIKIENLEFGFKNQKLLKNPFSTIIESGKLVTLIGKNGCGKSTFLKILARHLNNETGKIYLDSKDISTYSQIELAKKISWIGTEKINNQFISVEELVALGRHPYLNMSGQLNTTDKEHIQNSIELLNIETLTKKLFNNCSDGEKQKALIAKSLAQDSPVILLDEITSHLDFSNRHKTFEILKDLTFTKNKLVIIATHDIDLAVKYSDIVFLFNDLEIKEYQNNKNELVSEINHLFDGYFN